MNATSTREPGDETETKAAPGEGRALKVWQYEIPRSAYPFVAPADGTEPGFTLKMPKGARILCVGRSSRLNQAVVLALVNPWMEEEVRFFYVVKTNASIAQPQNLKVRVGGEAQDWSGARLEHAGSWEGFTIWWHLFEVVR